MRARTPESGYGHNDGASDDASSQASTNYSVELPLCPNDNGCPEVNDRSHQRQFAHTCRLFPCFHAHLRYHTHCFRHVPGQAAQPGGAASSVASGDVTPAETGSQVSSTGSSTRRSRAAKHRRTQRQALASVNFTHISPQAPNAKKITVLYASVGYEIFGDWPQVRVHTFKRYLFQVTGVRPVEQRLSIETGSGSTPLDDETMLMSEVGVDEGAQVTVHVEPAKGTEGADSVGDPKVPLSWL